MSQGARRIPIFVYAPDRNMFRLTSTHKNVPGSLLELLSKVLEAKLNVLSVTSTAVPGAESATLTLVVEGARDLTLQEVTSKLKPSPLVPKIEVEQAQEGLLVESGHFPIVMSGGERLVLMRADLFTLMIAELKKTFGSGGNVILYQMGYTYGESAMKKLISLAGKSFVQKNFRELGEIYTALGWGKPLDMASNPAMSEVTIRIENSFECKDQRSAAPISHFLRGHMTAVMDTVWGKRYASSETRCISCGEEYCEFTFHEE
ncbi:MAG: hypothetical protein JRM73_00505 [Nitrososphaerota archaeon]|nr:hypothetical protein [Nitrososphaerota archaeon]